MTVVIIEFKEINSVPHGIREALFHNETGKAIPKGFIADMEGKKIYRFYSYNQLKKKGWYNEFVEISKQEQEKPEVGSMAYMIIEKAHVQKLTNEVKQFKYGRPVLSQLNRMQSLAKRGGDEAKEAQAVINAVNEWGESQDKKIENLKTTQPTKAFIEMDSLLKTMRGIDLVNDYSSEMGVMKKDKYFAYLLGLRIQFEKLMDADKKSARTAKYLADKLTDFASKVKDDALKSDAEAMAEELSKI